MEFECTSKNFSKWCTEHGALIAGARGHSDLNEIDDSFRHRPGAEAIIISKDGSLPAN